MKTLFAVAVMFALLGVLFISSVTVAAVTVIDKNPLPFVIADPAFTVSADGSFYLIGGYGNNGSDIRTSNLRYNQSSDSWISLANMTTARWGATAAAVLDRIYVFSGAVTSGGATTNVTEVYNITTNTWSSRSPTPFLITGTGDCATNYGSDAIYILRQNELYLYSVSGDIFTEKHNLGADDTGTFMNCAIVGDFLYVIGGTTLRLSVRQYNILFDLWNANYDVAPYAQYGGLAKVVRDGIIYYGYGFDGTTFFSKMYSYDPLAKTFIRLPDGNHIRDGVGSAILGNKIYIAGGRFKVPAFGLDYVEEFDISPTAPVVTPIGGLGFVEFLLLVWIALLIAGFYRVTPLLFLAGFVGMALAYQSFVRYGDVIVPLVLAAVNLLVIAYGVDEYFVKMRVER